LREPHRLGAIVFGATHVGQGLRQAGGDLSAFRPGDRGGPLIGRKRGYLLGESAFRLRGLDFRQQSNGQTEDEQAGNHRIPTH
jgi:hypothetical protein